MEKPNTQNDNKAAEYTPTMSEETRTKAQNMVKTQTPQTVISQQEQADEDPHASTEKNSSLGKSNMRSRWKRKTSMAQKIKESPVPTSSIGQIEQPDSVNDAISKCNISQPQPRETAQETYADNTMTTNNRPSGDSRRQGSGKDPRRSSRPNQRSNRPQHTSKDRPQHQESQRGARSHRTHSKETPQAHSSTRSIPARASAKKKTLLEKISGVFSSILGTKKKKTTASKQADNTRSRPQSAEYQNKKKYSRPRHHNQHKRKSPPKA